MKQTLRIAFADFWPQFNWREAEPFRLFSEHYDLQVSRSPDLLFYSVFGKQHFKFRCHKVFLTGENVAPCLQTCDYAFSFAATDERNFQLPFFVWDSLYLFWRPSSDRFDIQPYRDCHKTKFCNFVFSNPQATERIDFCNKLMQYRRVDCPGKVLNNMPPLPSNGDRRPAKLNFIQDYKFTIAFENESAINYTTEKIFEPLLVGSIPIYWGNPAVTDYFNPACFINCHEFPDFDSVVKRVAEVEKSEELQKQYTSAPWFHPDSKAHRITEEAILTRFDEIVRSVRTSRPVSQTLSYTTYRVKRRIQRTSRKLERLIGLRPAG